MLVAVAKELRNVSFKIDAHIICPEQTTLECEYKLHPELSDIANAKGISRVVDNAITIGVNEEFMEAKMVMVTIRKCRTKNSRGRYFRLGFDYSRQKTHEIDSASEMATDNEDDAPSSKERMKKMSEKTSKLGTGDKERRDARNKARMKFRSI